MHTPPLILVPGLLCDDRLWEPVIPSLTPMAEITVTDFHTRLDSIARIAEAIVEVAPLRFSLAGLSMGGYIALEICRRFPDRVERLALLDTSARPDLPEQTARRRTMIELNGAGKFEQVVDMLYAVLVHDDRQTDNRLREAIIAMARRLGPEVFARQQQAIIDRIDQRPHLAAITCPTVVICGRQDKITPLECAEEMAAGIPAASLRIIENCGHMSTMERPEAVGPLLREWLASDR